MGTTDFSLPILKRLVSRNYEVVAVYTQPPRPSGRGKKINYGPVAKYALESGLPLYFPVTLQTELEVCKFRNLNADVAVVVAYGLLIPESILTLPKSGCFNIHPSLLPRWRGAAPIQRALMAGDKETGISIFKMDQGLDTGPVVLEKRVEIYSTDSFGTLSARLLLIAAEQILIILGNLGSFTPRKQAVNGITYAKKISNSERRIDWNNSARVIELKIRALSPTPGAWCLIRGERVKIISCKLGSSYGKPGEVLNSSLRIGCGEGSIDLLLVQRAGRSIMSNTFFLNGFPVKNGDRVK